MAAIYKRELGQYFKGMMGYIFIAVMIAAFAATTWLICIVSGYASMQYVLYYWKYAYIVIIPIIAMRSISEERRQHSDYLLFSTGVTPWQITMGKFLSMFTLIAIPVAASCAFPFILSTAGTVPMLTVFSDIIIFLFLGAAVVAMCEFFSSLTDSQIIAAVISYGVLIVAVVMEQMSSNLSATALGSFIALTVIVVLVGLIARGLSGSWNMAAIIIIILEVVLLLVFLLNSAAVQTVATGILSAIAIFSNFASSSSMMKGVFDITVLVYYISIAALFLFFTAQSIEKRKWS